MGCVLLIELKIRLLYLVFSVESLRMIFIIILDVPMWLLFFGLPEAFGSLYIRYFKPEVLAKLSVFFEAYYFVTRQYGSNFSKSSFQFIAYKTSYLAKHVAPKSKVQHLARIRLISYVQADEFMHRSNSINESIVPDAAEW